MQTWIPNSAWVIVLAAVAIAVITVGFKWTMHRRRKEEEKRDFEARQAEGKRIASIFGD